MRRQDIGRIVLAATLAAVPACGSDRNADRPDSKADDRAPSVDDAARRQPQTQAPSPTDRATGTTGAMSRADDVNGAGPDAIITMKIQAKYADDEIVKGRNIDVDTANGVVTLKGQVDTLRERDAAEQLARETGGVKRVINDLRVAIR